MGKGCISRKEEKEGRRSQLYWNQYKAENGGWEKELVNKKLNQLQEHIRSTILLLEACIMELPCGRVFFYNTREFIKNDDFSFALAGNAPLIVDKNSGEVVVT